MILLAVVKCRLQHVVSSATFEQRFNLFERCVLIVLIEINLVFIYVHENLLKLSFKVLNLLFIQQHLSVRESRLDSFFK
jgi:hypothetical protein